MWEDCGGGCSRDRIISFHPLNLQFNVSSVNPEVYLLVYCVYFKHMNSMLKGQLAENISIEYFANTFFCSGRNTVEQRFSVNVLMQISYINPYCRKYVGYTGLMRNCPHVSLR